MRSSLAHSQVFKGLELKEKRCRQDRTLITIYHPSVYSKARCRSQKVSKCSLQLNGFVLRTLLQQGILGDGHSLEDNKLIAIEVEFFHCVLKVRLLILNAQAKLGLRSGAYVHVPDGLDCVELMQSQ